MSEYPRCELCGQPVRPGQPFRHRYGKTVHLSCKPIGRKVEPKPKLDGMRRKVA